MVVIFAILAALYSYFQSSSIYGGDAGDLVSAAFTQGVAHPPGYPLYTVIGNLLTKLPFGTVAWRVSFLSSVPSAFTLVLLYLLFKKLTKQVFFPLTAIFSLGFVYLFWLYAEVPETFALFSLFIVGCTLALIFWEQQKKIKFLYLFFFLFGLSLTHHHVILFMVPAFVYWIYSNRQLMPKHPAAFWLKALVLFVAGLIPYSYVYFAARNIPLVNWENPTTISGFVRLVTRAYYGTFQSNPYHGMDLANRLYQIHTYVSMLYADFTLFGVILCGIGGYYMWVKQRKFFIFSLLAVAITGPFFLFYASFQLITNFKIGTFERFMLPSYLFLATWLCYGMMYVSSLSATIMKRYLKAKSRALAIVLINSIFIIYPLSLVFINYPKISILKKDVTAENLAYDLLDTVEEDGIFLPIGDTAYFNSVYVSTAFKYRPDVALLHLNLAFEPVHHAQMQKYYPQLVWSGLTGSADGLSVFIRNNYDKHPIYSTFYLPTSIDDGAWAQEGLLYRFYMEKDLPPQEVFVKRNKELWAQYHDPFSGSLGVYDNLMLSNVLEVHEVARVSTGKAFLKLKKYADAREQFEQAVRLDPVSDENHYLLGYAYAGLNQCDQAKNNLEKSIGLNQNQPLYYLYLAQTYKDCFKNDAKAREYQSIFEQKMKSRETSLSDY